MGPLSEVIRAPFVAVAGHSELSRYRAGLVPCLLALAGLGAWLAATARRAGRPLWFRLAVAVGVVWNPITVAAVHWGHPEELVTGVLLVAAALAVRRDRPVWAGLCAGLAVVTKLWAIVGVPLLLVVVVGRARREFVVALTIVAGVATGLTAVAAPARFAENARDLGRLGSAPGTVSVANVWWPLATSVSFEAPEGTAPDGHVARERVSGYELPSAAARVAHLLILLAGVVVAALWAGRGRQLDIDRALLALALALLLRCVLDPGTFSYYHAAFAIALVSYEAVSARRFPWLSVSVLMTFWLLTRAFSPAHAPVFDAAYLVWSLGWSSLLAYLLLAQRSARR